MVKATERIKEAVAEILDRSTHLDVAKATQAIAKKFGLNQRLINYTHIELRNKLSEYGFKATPYSKRVLFLPHCMRNSKHCKAEHSEEGIVCKKCGKCDIAELVDFAENLGYSKAFIVPGGSMVQKIIKRHNPMATMGICCYHEANLAFDSLRGTKIHPQVSLLLQDGCNDTKANLAEVKEKLVLIDEKVFGKQSKGLKN